MASAPTDVRAVQDGPSSISVTWTPPIRLGITTGYKISYTGTSSSGSENVNGSSMSSHTLTGLNSGDTYTVSILGTATGVGLLSPAVAQIEPVGLGESGTILSIGYIIIAMLSWLAPLYKGGPDITLKESLCVYISTCTVYGSRGRSKTVGFCSITVPYTAAIDTTTPATTTTNTITITGSTPNGSIVTGFVVHWKRNTSTSCSDSDEGTISVAAGSFTNYAITGLEEGSWYTFTVRTSNTAGNSAPSNTLAAMTLETGEADIYNY